MWCTRAVSSMHMGRTEGAKMKVGEGHRKQLLEVNAGLRKAWQELEGE